MNVGSLFTGVGGFDLGLERAGHDIVFQCEVEAKRREVLAQHWPGVSIYDDVRVVADGSGDAADHGPINLLCGGFPCQDLSVAGKRAGLAGERSGLFYEFMRVADTLLDDGGWVLAENVPGLFSSQHGRDFGIVLASLADIGFYDVAWRVLDSRFFGVPQRRRRVFILARRARGRRAAEVLLEPESGGGDLEASGQAREEAPARSKRSAGGDRQWPADVTSTLNTKFGSKMGLEDQHALGGASCFVPARREGATDTARCLTTGDRYDSATQDFVIREEADADGVREAAGVPGRVDDSEAVGPPTAFHATQTPISSSDHTPAHGKSAQVGVQAFTQNSRDEVRFIGGDGRQVGALAARPGAKQQAYLLSDDVAISEYACPLDLKPDSHRYAAVGDAVTVNVAEWLGRRLIEFGEGG